MKARIFLWIGVVVAAVAIWFLFNRSHVKGARGQEAPTTPAKVGNSTNKVSVGGPPGNRPPAKTGQSNEDIENMSLEGRISRKEAMLESVREKNRQSQDFYGKVIDQYGQPVPDASVTGATEMITGLGDNSTPQTYKTESDSEGLFQFTGIRGWQFDVSVEKSGYVLNARGRGYNGPAGGRTSPDNRGVFTMWKLRGSERLISSSIHKKIPHDGTPVAFDTTTGKILSNGDLRVTLSQFPLEVKTGRERFNWAVKVEVVNGGLIEENDPYPFWAPSDGYQPSFEFSVSSNAPDWAPDLQKDFYIKNAMRQYGRMQFSVYPGRSPTGLEVEITINPSGSQNLEPQTSQGQ